MSTASQKPHEEHIVDGDLYGRGKKRPKHGTEVTQMHSLGSQITDFMNNMCYLVKRTDPETYVLTSRFDIFHSSHLTNGRKRDKKKFKQCEEWLKMRYRMLECWTRKVKYLEV